MSGQSTEEEMRARHTCMKTMESRSCHACNTGVHYPHQSVDEMIDGIARGVPTTRAIRFFVDGTPVSKGNHTAFPMTRGRCKACRPGKPCRRKCCLNGMIIGAVVSDDNGPELKAWEGMVRIKAISARNALGLRIYDKGVAVIARFVFLMPRPTAHHTPRGELSADGSRKPFPITRPDFDKLTRAAADGMTGALYEDDSQIVHAPITKLWARARPGVLISVEPMERIPDDILAELSAVGFRSFDTQPALL